MTSSDSRPLPEELILLCAHPKHGRFRAPVSEFHHAVAGAVLAELLLAGAITVEKRHITGYQPFGARDEVEAGVLARLEAKGKSRFRPVLDQAITRVPNPPGHRFHLDRLVAQGCYTVAEKRILGLPWRTHLLTRPELRQQTADRVAATLLNPHPSDPRLTDPPGGGDRPSVERDRQLAGLIGVSGLEHRLYPGRSGAPVRRAVRKLAWDLPIPQAVRRVSSSN
ncbi:GPP34 family phosphoprotein [Kitasatospora sp. NPDC097691]|uniref:GOLPH3/VPS74 family protein n=1 Tax=Kitasatospora sp. NPDC097691 TaxID=3157231 RepID=UPI0033317A8A